MTTTESHILLRDGRLLGYAGYGDPGGKPLLFFHGVPGSRMEHHPDNAIAKALGWCVIVPDRPGYGLSDPEPNRTLLGWADDVQQLMDNLDIRSCALAGFSGGGPFAAACAIAMPERVTRLSLISSLAPLDNPYGTEGMNEQSQAMFGLARSDPEGFAAQIQSLVTDSEALFQIMTAGLPRPDTDLFALPGISAMYRADMAAAAAQGTEGIVRDMLLLSRKWGFEAKDIRCPTSVWQGMADINVPPSMGRYWAENIPGCQSHFLPGEGHFMLFRHWREILEIA